ncbi:MAG: hypothetical protein CVU39_14310 [Chloroflexi bacterium HGW-Chloroflexi-10]|nr:MAG: hypothetical protein CVU39_14310 [Chloroflexi bacterium HGW-Chloroflexi-10]
MKHIQEAQFLFIVRIWTEAGQTQNTWRGSVENIPSGQRLYFTSLNDLNDFIKFSMSGTGRELNPGDL